MVKRRGWRKSRDPARTGDPHNSFWLLSFGGRVYLAAEGQHLEWTDYHYMCTAVHATAESDAYYAHYTICSALSDLPCSAPRASILTAVAPIASAHLLQRAPSRQLMRLVCY